MPGPTDRYTAIAIILHWAIAAAILLNLPLGLWMHHAIDERETQAQAIAAYQIHKSIGLTVLALSLVRLAWRLFHPPPPLPEAMPAWEKMAARATHWAFYFLIIAIPLSGWIYVSAQWRGDAPFNVPTLFFGAFNVPHLFGLAEQSQAVRADAAEAAIEAHELLARGAMALVALHVAAALKHHFYDRDATLTHMVPGLRAHGLAPPPPEPKRRAALIAGFAAIAAALIALTAAIFSTPAPTQEAALFDDEEEYPYAQPAPLQEAAPAAPTPDMQIEPGAQAPPLPTVGVMGNPRTAAAPGVQGGPPPAWTVNAAASEIAFSGTHAAVAFRGRFAQWSADIRFDPENLEQSTATVTIQTASASDGISLHDQSLPGDEWFDVRDHPTATFRSTRIRHRDGNEYEARGVLTIKGRPIEIDLPFTLAIEGDRATMSGRVRLDRRDADLGMDSDPDADYVSRNINVDVRLEATRSP